MKIGIGLPASIPGVSGQLIIDWARRAEARQFSSLGIIDRLVYPNLEPLMTLAVAAGATERIRLMTTVLVTPLRNAGMLAKEAATLDHLSNGRLTLGLGVGARDDDFRVASVPFHQRGRRFEEQLATMKHIWSGEPFDADTGPVGPPAVRPGGPEILIGGYSPAAIRRVGRWGDGIILGGSANAELAKQFRGVAEEAWQAEGRSGKPRLVTCVYFGLGPDSAQRSGATIRHYYSFMGQRAENIANSLPTTPEAIKQIIQNFASIEVDELVFWPTIPDLDQIDRLADCQS
jgi:alkanesulfonate monooxygenase SsuD/methylene tetrahydromethanopterin reductase-like flavin-dependent oxidoreductase (luciferase family)